MQTSPTGAQLRGRRGVWLYEVPLIPLHFGVPLRWRLEEVLWVTVVVGGGGGRIFKNSALTPGVDLPGSPHPESC